VAGSTITFVGPVYSTFFALPFLSAFIAFAGATAGTVAAGAAAVCVAAVIGVEVSVVGAEVGSCAETIWATISIGALTSSKLQLLKIRMTLDSIIYCTAQP
jgi:hypothetical protein